MTWNHRVVRHDGAPSYLWFGVHEVYYDKEGKPATCTVGAVPVVGETVEELRESLGMMQRALDQPVLSMKDDFIGDDLRKEAEDGD